MKSQLQACPQGHYRYLPGIEPYSCGVVAEPGWEIIHVRLAAPLPWRTGMQAVRERLESNGRDRFGLCAVELRCPEPHTMEGFLRFNGEYRQVLSQWEMLLGEANPIARTNVAPVIKPPDETMLYAFSFTTPSEIQRPTFIVAGGGELRGALKVDNILRAGETNAEAMRAKAACVVQLMRERLAELAHDQITSKINVYTEHGWREILTDVIIPKLPAAARLGVSWHYTRPPVKDIEFEMDMRGVVRDEVWDFS